MLDKEGASKNKAANTGVQVGTWLDGVQMGQEHSGDNVGQWSAGRMDQPGAQGSIAEGLVASGAQLLTEVGLDQNTTQFISAQAARAKSRSVSRGASAIRDVNFNASTVTGHAVRGHPMMNVTGHRPSTAANVGTLGCDVTGNPKGSLATSQQQHGAMGTGLSGPIPADPDSDGESINSNIKKCKPVKSGMLAMPTDNIKTQQVWPYYNLAYSFVTETVQFHQLSFEQFVAGELKTVLDTTDPFEIRGRLGLMSRLAYLKQKGFTWSNL